jgi:hypothetical protein
MHGWYYLAIDKGYFAAEKLDVTVDQGEGSAATVNRIMSGAYDAGFGDVNAIIQNASTKPAETPVMIGTPAASRARAVSRAVPPGGRRGCRGAIRTACNGPGSGGKSWGCSAGWSLASPPALPPAFADIPVERLEQAREWLAQQPEVDGKRIGVMGTSKGAEVALLAGTKMPWIRAIVAMVPTDVVWEGWGPGVVPGTRSSFAWKGEPFPFVPYKDFDKEFAGFQTGADVKIRRPQDAGRAANPGRVQFYTVEALLKEHPLEQ